MKKILLLGLHTDPNLGDGLITSCAELLTEKALRELNIQDEYEVAVSDIRGLDFRKHLEEHKIRTKEINTIVLPKKRGLKEFILKVHCKLFPEGNTAVNRRQERERQKNLLKEQARAQLEQYMCERSEMLDRAAKLNAEKTIDTDTAAIIFAGGGLIKYGGHQLLAKKLEPYFRRADKMGIPVMLNAVGVEGYDENDEECCILKDILNLPCVKIVSTRDDVDTLREKYIERDHITVTKVPCPALWASEFYPRKRHITEGKQKSIIGLGMARGQLFIDNGVDITPEMLDSLWSAVIDEMEKRGYDWRVFTNGYDGDQHYAARFLEKREEALQNVDQQSGSEKTLCDEKLTPCPHTPEQLIDTVTSFDGIIACRLHAAVTAYSYGVPAAEFVWNVKQPMFGEWAGIANRFVSPDANNLASSAAKAVDALESAIDEGYPECDMDKQKTYEQLRDFIKVFVKDGGNAIDMQADLRA